MKLDIINYWRICHPLVVGSTLATGTTFQGLARNSQKTVIQHRTV
jgi:hypothetical protein